MITTDTGAKKIENSDNWRLIFDAHNDSVDAEDKIVPEMAPIVNGNKSTVGAAIGEYVLVRNSSITGITDGAYTAAKAIPANTTIDSTYLTAVGTGGALNALNSKIGTKFKYTYVSVAVGTGITPIGGCAWRSDYKSIGAGKKIVSVIPRAYTGGLFIPVVRYDSRDQFCLFGTYSENITCDVIYADSADIT